MRRRLAVSRPTDPARRLSLEYVDHLHEHMAQPVEVTEGRYRLPTQPGAGTAFQPGAGTAFQPGTAAAFAYPTGTEWAP